MTWFIDACMFVRGQDAGLHTEQLAAAVRSADAWVAATVRDGRIGARPTQKQLAFARAWNLHSLPVLPREVSALHDGPDPRRHADSATRSAPEP